MTAHLHEEAVQRLMEAEKTKVPIRPLTEVYPGISVEDAYRIQLAAVERKTMNGARVVGKKIGLTSKAMQDMFNVTQPDYGHLLDSMMHVDGEVIDIGAFLQPKLEVEIAFILKEDIKGPGISSLDVINATDYVVPAFEIIDSRIQDWKIAFEDTVADNGSSACAVLGGIPTPLEGLDLHHIGMVMSKNGRQMDTAAGAAVMGNPIRAVAWLANAIGEYGIALRAGEVILSGAFTAAVPVEAGDTFTAEFAHIGFVAVSFSKEGETI
ncbi:2-keto-4-pentenoate hydratase [Aneurinibacillus aneurinilyticus]|uniref:2-keto-4-pentenoate hydratase n=1 Tax=Aneurinibacillus aneurinilyticus TaxID=1391 RepID=A0A848CPR8_ANEAE|nr:fumarylacetoacetate hydrolase family protein [Aneurinibacillus aneurinilyticus]NME97813.1 2-keto-4-pentenoate hydratase [Aneurinibacillus aneurinilyticus]